MKQDVVAVVLKSEEPVIEQRKQVISNKEVLRRYAFGDCNFSEFGFQQDSKNIKLYIFIGYEQKPCVITEDRCYKSRTQYSDLKYRPFVFTHKTLGWLIKLGLKADSQSFEQKFQYSLEVNCVKFEDMAVVQPKMKDT